jgi:hypothetical protein
MQIFCELSGGSSGRLMPSEGRPGAAPTVTASGSRSVRQSCQLSPCPFCSRRKLPSGSASAPNLRCAKGRLKVSAATKPARH